MAETYSPGGQGPPTQGQGQTTLEGAPEGQISKHISRYNSRRG